MSWHWVDYPNHSKLDVEKSYKRYCETLGSMDGSIGAFVRQLEEMGIHNGTLVINMGDNGFMFGGHGLIGKRVGCDPSMRVPMLLQCSSRITTDTSPITDCGTRKSCMTCATILQNPATNVFVHVAVKEPPIFQGQWSWSNLRTHQRSTGSPRLDRLFLRVPQFRTPRPQKAEEFMNEGV